MLQLQCTCTFHVDYSIENGTNVPIFFHCESPATYTQNNLQNMIAALCDIKLYHNERSSKLTPKQANYLVCTRELRSRVVTRDMLFVSADTRLNILYICMCVIEMNKIYMVISTVL